eukprot:15365-Heterococcus_DN1.PRE.3
MMLRATTATAATVAATCPQAKAVSLTWCLYLARWATCMLRTRALALETGRSDGLYLKAESSSATRMAATLRMLISRDAQLYVARPTVFKSLKLAWARTDIYYKALSIGWATILRHCAAATVLLLFQALARRGIQGLSYLALRAHADLQ